MSQPAPAGQGEPAGRVGARASELFQIVRTGDRRAARRYLRTAFADTRSDDQTERDLYELGRLFLAGRGNLTLLKIRRLGPNEAALIYRNELLQLNRALIVTVEEAAPYRITGWDKASAGWGDVPAAVAASDEEAGRLVDAYAARLASAEFFSGTIVLARGDKVVLNKSYGLAERNHLIRNSADTRYNLASISKMFTALAVAQLVERGLLSYDDPVAKYLPGYLSDEDGRQVLIRHLLSHTSGLQGNVLVPLVAGEASLRLNSHEDYLGTVARKDRALQFAPGSRHLYSNHGYILLGRIIEVASGEDYYAYVRRHVFEPAGMADTSFPHLEDAVPRQAVGYETFWRDSGPWTENNWLRIPARGLASGGAYSTAADLLRFGAALRAGRLVRPDSLAVMTTPSPASPDYGFGFALGGAATGRSAGHTGDLAGVCTSFEMHDGGRYPFTIVLLSNSSMGSCRPVHDKILQVFSSLHGK